MAVTRVVDKSGRVIEYERRRPENSVYYRIVQQHIQTVFSQAEENGSGYPAHVKREFERFMSCGVLAAGFARIQCAQPGCTSERLVAYACKGRCICPSCVCRRMADCAAHLVDRVLPIAPYRQWTLSLPYDVRFRVGYDKTLLGQVLSIFVRTISAYQRLRARRVGISEPLTGAVTLCQRYGSILQFTPHFHTWMPDGVFCQDDAGTVQLHPLGPPEDDDIDALLLRISQRVDRLLSGADEPVVDDDTLAAAVTPPIVAGRHDHVKRPRCAFFEGYSLHADLAVASDERKKLEKFIRYGLRPPFSQKRLSLTPEGKVCLKLRKPFYTGQSQIVLEPTDFLRRLIATIPPKRMNMVRFHGAFAPRATVRPALRSLLPSAAPAVEEPLEADGARPADAAADDAAANVDDETAGPPQYRRPWHQLLKRVFGLNILICPRCGHKMHRISHIEDPPTIHQILSHLNLPTQLPRMAPARAPPQLELDFEDDADDASFDQVEHFAQ